MGRATSATLAQLDAWVAHKPPKSYPVFPYRGLRTVEQRPLVVVGRSMIESVVAPDGWVRCGMSPLSFLFFWGGGAERGREEGPCISVA